MGIYIEEEDKPPTLRDPEAKNLNESLFVEPVTY